MAKYYYIDDDPNSQNKVQGFENDELLIVARQHENSWEEQLNFIKEKEYDYDGLILDLKLDDLPNSNDKRADFRGTSLAQEIRTRQKEGLLKCFPIVLFSANDKTQQALEKSGMDLFDIYIDKSKLDDKAFLIYAPQIIDVSVGYKRLSDSSLFIKDVFNITESQIDSRFIFEYNETKKSPVHIQARFLITEFLDKQGLLVDEDVLAARLGIDKDKSEDWCKLLVNLTFAKYNGVFSKGWTRWWMHLIEQWWKEISGSNEFQFLRSTAAPERVEKIKQATQLTRLVSAEKIDKANSDRFWTVCKGHNRPLDPVDGLLIQGQDNLYSWQEPEYVSVDAALWRKNIDNWISVADVEKERYETLKTLYSRKRQ